MSGTNEEITFYDSVTGKPLFIAPKGRSFEDFVKESRAHGWPSFRDEEVLHTNSLDFPPPIDSYICMHIYIGCMG
jgi:hypothetical protein